MHQRINRKDFFACFSGFFLGGSLFRTRLLNGEMTKGPDFNEKEHLFDIRSVTVWVEDLLRWNWPQKTHGAGLNTISLHHDPDTIVAFLKSEQGNTFIQDCKSLGLMIEHSLHSYSSLLPRHLYKQDPSLFRMNRDGERTNDFNFCVSNKNTLEIVCENAIKYSRLLPSTTGRYFYNTDDAKNMCSCPKCRGFSDSDQTLMVENSIIAALRKDINPEATIGHIAYVYTMTAPRQIKPEPCVFLEWAPITRTYDKPITYRDAKDGEHGRLLDCLYENLDVFGKKDSQVFEYWFDSYRASGWKTKEENWIKAPWNPEVLHEDLAFYVNMGIRNITSVTCWMNQDYVDRFGEPHLQEYGRQLLSF